MNKEDVEKLQATMENIGEVHTLLARTDLPPKEYNVISPLLALAKVSLFNFYIKVKTENLKNAYCNGGNSSKDVSIGFIDWIGSEGYIRLSKRNGHKWFKVKSAISQMLTTEELFELYLKSKI